MLEVHVIVALSQPRQVAEPLLTTYLNATPRYLKCKALSRLSAAVILSSSIKMSLRLYIHTLTSKEGTNHVDRITSPQKISPRNSSFARVKEPLTGQSDVTNDSFNYQHSPGDGSVLSFLEYEHSFEVQVTPPSRSIIS